MNSREYACIAGFDNNLLEVGKVGGACEVDIYFQMKTVGSEEVVVITPEQAQTLITQLQELITK